MVCVCCQQNVVIDYLGQPAEIGDFVTKYVGGVMSDGS